MFRFTSSIEADYVLFFYGLNKKLGPINDWGISLSENKIPVNTENYQTNKEGIFAVGDGKWRVGWAFEVDGRGARVAQLLIGHG